jgi:hypothetical protein
LKSGTNSFHGLAYIYSENRNFNAIDQAKKNQGFTQNQRFDDNRIGGNFGGPIFKNKLFFFGSMQYQPHGEASVSSAANCTPTAAGYTTISGISGISATNLGVFKQYATPAPAGGNCPAVPTTDPAGKPNTGNNIFITNPSAPGGFTAVQVGILPVAAPNYQNQLTGLVSIDYDISAKDQIRGRYIYNSLKQIDATPSLPAFFLLNPALQNRLVTFNEYHTFSASLSNEFRLGFNRTYSLTDTGNFKFPGLDSFPNLSYDELGGLQLGPDPNGPQFTYQNVYQASENLTWTSASKGASIFRPSPLPSARVATTTIRHWTSFCVTRRRTRLQSAASAIPFITATRRPGIGMQMTTGAYGRTLP